VSYILDALRKAERDRRVSPVPTLDAAHESPAPARLHGWPWAFAGALVLSAVATYGLWGLWASGPPDPVRQALAPPRIPARQRSRPRDVLRWLSSPSSRPPASALPELRRGVRVPRGPPTMVERARAREPRSGLPQPGGRAPRCRALPGGA
jgi:general secretion pathway protein B